MPEPPSFSRWRAALAQAARRTVGARWRSTLDALETARVEYRALCAAAAVDVRALRQAARRLHGLEQLRAALVRELQLRNENAR